MLGIRVLGGRFQVSVFRCQMSEDRFSDCGLRNVGASQEQGTGDKVPEAINSAINRNSSSLPHPIALNFG
jgi:hypothetical protein